MNSTDKTGPLCDNFSALCDAVMQKHELLEALSDLLDELDSTGLSTMPGEIYSGLRRSCEEAKALRHTHETAWD